MALNFPLNPADGDTYEGYVYDATAGVWNSNPHQIASRFVTSATAPSSPSEGDGWFDTNTAKSYVYYDGVWVQLGALGTVDLNQIADVNVSSPANGESLVYDGTDWTNQNVSVDVYDVSTSSTGKFALPAGTTAERPVAPNAGDIRFNTETGEPEWYSSSASEWISFRSPLPGDVTVEYLIVAGGASGGASDTSFGGGGGGGAGGLLNGSTTLSSPASFTVTLGAGGAAITTARAVGSNGSNTLALGLTAVGGGGGGSNSSGLSGGSGGGAYGYPHLTYSGGAGTVGQGNAGGLGNSDDVSYTNSGGGGGAGGVGGNATSSAGGAGGDGAPNTITGAAQYYAGGGGGGFSVSGGQGGVGGQGGGGDGADAGVVGSSGLANTGGGGGGGSIGSPYSSGAGGSGLFIIKYPDNKNLSIGNGLVASTVSGGGYKITTFTAGTDTVTLS